MTAEGLISLFSGTVRTFKADSPLVYQGEVPRHGYLIKRGITKAYTLQSNGEERLATFLGAGDFFPLPWLFGQTNTSLYYYETTQLSELIAVTRQDIDKIVGSHLEVQNYLLHKFVKDNAAHLMRVTALEQTRAAEKLIFTLYYLMYQFGTEVKKDTYVIGMQLTHSTIASLVGLTRETTAVELKRLSRKGIVSYSKRQYTLRKSLLEKAMGEDSFSELITGSQAS